MARRASRVEGTLLLLVVSIGLPIYIVSKIFQTTGWLAPALVIAAVVVLIVWYKHSQQQKRLMYLRAKYRDEKIVQDIFSGSIWHGQTEEQLRDSIGQPVAIDNKLIKTMTRDVWKYHPAGAGRE